MQWPNSLAGGEPGVQGQSTRYNNSLCNIMHLRNLVNTNAWLWTPIYSVYNFAKLQHKSLEFAKMEYFYTKTLVWSSRYRGKLTHRYGATSKGDIIVREGSVRRTRHLEVKVDSWELLWRPGAPRSPGTRAARRPPPQSILNYTGDTLCNRTLFKARCSKKSICLLNLYYIS